MLTISLVKKQWLLLNKSEFHKAIILSTWAEEKEDFKEKNLKTIIDALISPKPTRIPSKETATPSTTLINSMQSISTKEWLKSLKTLCLLHYIINTFPQHFSAQFASTKGFSIVVTPDLKSSKIPTKDCVHIGILPKYLSFLTAYNDRIEKIQYLSHANIHNTLTFTQEYQNIKYIMKIFPQIQFFQRDLEAAISIYSKICVTKRMVAQISYNLSQVYAIAKRIVTRVLPQFIAFETTSQFRKFFAFYSDFIIVTRNLNKFNNLKMHLSSPFDKLFTPIELYTIDKELNKSIELHNLSIKHEMCDEDSVNASSASGVHIEIITTNPQLEARGNTPLNHENEYDEEIEIVIPSKSILPIEYVIKSATPNLEHSFYSGRPLASPSILNTHYVASGTVRLNKEQFDAFGERNDEETAFANENTRAPPSPRTSNPSIPSPLFTPAALQPRQRNPRHFLFVSKSNSFSIAQQDLQSDSSTYARTEASLPYFAEKPPKQNTRKLPSSIEVEYLS